MGVRIIVQIEDTNAAVGERVQLTRELDDPIGSVELVNKASHLAMMAAYAATGTTPGVPF